MGEAWELMELESSNEKLGNDKGRVADTVDKGPTTGEHPAAAGKDASNDKDGKPVKLEKGIKREPTEPDSTSKKPKTKLDEALATAQKVKNHYLTVMSGASALVRIIKGETEWTWARTDESLGTLKLLLAEVCDCLDAADKRLVTEELKNLKAETSPEQLTPMATRFAASKPKIDAVDKKQKALLSAHGRLKG